MGTKLKTTVLVLIAGLLFAAASATAQAAPKFTVEGVAAGNEAITAAAGVTPVGGVLTLTVPNLLWITCSSLTVNGGTITVNTEAGAATSLSFGGCSVDAPNGAAAPACSVRNVGGIAGTITTGEVAMKLIEVGGNGDVTFKPVGAAFAEVQVEGAGCTLAGKNKLTGTFAVKVSSPVKTVLNPTVELESSQAIQEASADALKYGARAAYLDGRIDLTLTSGKKWGYDL
jgi:hypothetical protein